jgi:hypothetical protein
MGNPTHAPHATSPESLVSLMPPPRRAPSLTSLPHRAPLPQRTPPPELQYHSSSSATQPHERAEHGTQAAREERARRALAGGFATVEGPGREAGCAGKRRDSWSREASGSPLSSRTPAQAEDEVSFDWVQDGEGEQEGSGRVERGSARPTSPPPRIYELKHVEAFPTQALAIHAFSGVVCVCVRARARACEFIRTWQYS